MLKYIPDRFKTVETSEKAVEEDPCMIRYVPDYLKTQEMCFLAVRKALGYLNKFLIILRPKRYAVRQWMCGLEHFFMSQIIKDTRDVSPRSKERSIPARTCT